MGTILPAVSAVDSSAPDPLVTDANGAKYRLRQNLARLAGLSGHIAEFNADGSAPVDMVSLIAGEDLTNNVMRTEQQGTPFAINSAATTLVANAPGHVHSIRVVGGTLGNVTIYNSLAASGAVLLPTVTPVANGVLLENIDFTIGLTIVTAASTVIVGSFR